MTPSKNNISYILTEPQRPENIGAAARAMKTMGFSDMRLVKPASFPAKEAFYTAHGSADILEKAKVFDSLKKAVADIDFIVGTSAKKRSVKHDRYEAQQLPELISAKGSTIKKTGIVFGGEESGLSNDVLSQCHMISFVPMAAEYPSLNLGQAVMIYACILGGMEHRKTAQDAQPENHEYQLMLKKLNRQLLKIGFDRDSSIFNRIIERAGVLSETDIHLLLSVCNKLDDHYGREPDK